MLTSTTLVEVLFPCSLLRISSIDGNLSSKSFLEVLKEATKTSVQLSFVLLDIYPLTIFTCPVCRYTVNILYQVSYRPVIRARRPLNMKIELVV